jgi:two-component system, chemotaxis family, CheB/CheR fusion protein
MLRIMAMEKQLLFHEIIPMGFAEIEGIFNYVDYGSVLLQEFQKGNVFLSDDIPNDPLITAKEKEEHQKLQLRATINKPLLKNGKLSAILFVHFKNVHHWTSEEIDLIDETAERTWAAVEWARAEEALRIAEDNYRTRLENEVKIRTAELLENKQFTQLITDSVPDLLFVYDIRKWKIIYVNKGITAILGYLPDEVYASDRNGIEQMLHPDDLKRRMDEMAQLVNLKSGEVRETEFRIKDRNGNIHWLNVRDLFFKADKNGNTVQALSICQDVTEKVEVIDAYRKEKRRSEELKRMNELMDTFVFAAAHDLKAPVSNLKMLTQVIRSTHDTEKKLMLQQRYSEVIETLDNTISGLVKVLAIEKDLTTGFKMLNFEKVFFKIQEELTDEINNIEPEIHTDFAQCKSIMYIESYLFSIFRNLLSNALKFRSKDRKLKISVRTVYENEYVGLTFSDNGTGIDLSQYGDDIFKPFKRFTSKTIGSGLGLHLLKRIITKNGGKIEVESRKSEGTTFKIYMVPYKD